MFKKFSNADLDRKLRDEDSSCLHPLKEPADFYDPISISERLVQAIWADQRFLAKNLRTREGTTLTVVRPGRWNREGGPDFLNGSILLGGSPHQGDIEIHLYTSGWSDHHHASNSAYDRVVLDVCLWDDGHERSIQTSSGKIIPQLILHPYLETPLDELTESIESENYPFASWRPRSTDLLLSSFPLAELERSILSAGLYRFEKKVSQFKEWIHTYGEDETAYFSLAGALGYKHNKLIFRDITMGIPLKKLLLLSGSKKKAEALLEISRTFPIRFHSVRPANHPHRRLVALALMLEAHPRLGAWFHQLALDPQKLRLPPRLEDPFWSWHTRHGGRRLPSPVALLGLGRWREIVTNVILPFVYVHNESSNIRDLWMRWPASPSNHKVRQMIYDLDASIPQNNGIQQGLIQMSCDFE